MTVCHSIVYGKTRTVDLSSWCFFLFWPISPIRSFEFRIVRSCISFGLIGVEPTIRWITLGAKLADSVNLVAFVDDPAISVLSAFTPVCWICDWVVGQQY